MLIDLFNLDHQIRHLANQMTHAMGRISKIAFQSQVIQKSDKSMALLLEELVKSKT